MSDRIRWINMNESTVDIAERTFQIERPGGIVPGVAWLPQEHAKSCPLVLLGHGGSGHKKNERNVLLGKWFASTVEIAAVAIDGPFHGDRVGSPLTPVQYQRKIEIEGMDAVATRMVSDWQATVAAINTLDFVDTTRLGYFGLSMGTRFGLPLCAAVGAALRCAVFGKFGLSHAPGFYEGSDMTQQIRISASQIVAPTLFHLQWDDELFPREGQLELFDTLGSREKQLIAYAGAHGQTNPTAATRWTEFMARHLRPGFPALDPIVAS